MELARLYFRVFCPVSCRQPILFKIFLICYVFSGYNIIYKEISDIKKQKLCLIEEEAFILLNA